MTSTVLIQKFFAFVTCILIDVEASPTRAPKFKSQYSRENKKKKRRSSIPRGTPIGFDCYYGRGDVPMSSPSMHSVASSYSSSHYSASPYGHPVQHRTPVHGSNHYPQDQQFDGFGDYSLPPSR